MQITRGKPDMTRILINAGIITGLIGLAMVPLPAPAQNTQFFRSAPVAYLNDEDIEIVKSALQDALNEQADDETVAWANPKTGASGSIKVLDTHEDYATTCRNIEMENHAAGRTGKGGYRLCKADDGTWKFAPTRRSQ
jgi:surface antigen